MSTEQARNEPFERLRHTSAARAMVEWADNAYGKGSDLGRVWREHAALIEREAIADFLDHDLPGLLAEAVITFVDHNVNGLNGLLNIAPDDVASALIADIRQRIAAPSAPGGTSEGQT